MPIYEYRCENGHQFEVIQRMTDDPVSECVTCAEPVEKIFHPIAVHFKGKGFYNTDYGTRKRARETKEYSDSKSSSSEGGSNSSDSGKSDSGKVDSGKSDSGSKAKAEATSSTSSKPATYSSD
jgi:putative FmdB family regulatory protein